jgi:hypothetical protein
MKTKTTITIAVTALAMITASVAFNSCAQLVQAHRDTYPHAFYLPKQA